MTGTALRQRIKEVLRWASITADDAYIEADAGELLHAIMAAIQPTLVGKDTFIAHLTRRRNELLAELDHTRTELEQARGELTAQRAQRANTVILPGWWRELLVDRDVPNLIKLIESWRTPTANTPAIERDWLIVILKSHRWLTFDGQCSCGRDSRRSAHPGHVADIIINHLTPGPHAGTAEETDRG